MANGRTIAIGDIHGNSLALSSMIWQIDPQPNDTIVTLGDYVDRGIDSSGTLDILMNLAKQCHLVPLLGNHDKLMLDSRDDPQAHQAWLELGGGTTLESYGWGFEPAGLEEVKPKHWRFLESCRLFFETDTHLFVHANYDATLPLPDQSPDVLLWRSLLDSIPAPHVSGKIAVVGHTPQPGILDFGHLICIDTGLADGGCLTALDVEGNSYWRVDALGRRP